MKNHQKILCYFTAVCLATIVALPLQAQYKMGDAVDKIVAIVGNEIILQSDLMSYVLMAAQNDRKVNPNDPKTISMTLDMMINERLVIIKAIEDSVTVSEEEINEKLDFQLQMLRGQLGSDRRIEEVYGMPIAKIRRDFRDDVRKRILSEKISQQKFAGIKVTSKEVQDFYTQYKDSLPMIPPQYDLYHIVKNVQASEATKEKTIQLAQRIRDSIIAGGKFADFAKRYSDDPGSKNSGGELGLVTRGNFIAEFEKVAYFLQPGEISQPVETPFGYHIIQLVEKQEDAINTRHILLAMKQSGDDGERTKLFLDSLRQRVEKGESFESLAKSYSDDNDTKAFGGYLGKIEVSKLPGEMKTQVEKLEDGKITLPMLYNNPASTKVAYHIIWRKKYSDEHAVSFTEDYKRIEQMAMAQKRSKMYEEWLKDLRKTIYWEIKK